MLTNTYNTKTIFLCVSGKVQARNILRSDVFTELNTNKKIRLILFVPKYKVEEYKKEFNKSSINFITYYVKMF